LENFAKFSISKFIKNIYILLCAHSLLIGSSYKEKKSVTLGIYFGVQTFGNLFVFAISIIFSKKMPEIREKKRKKTITFLYTWFKYVTKKKRRKVKFMGCINFSISYFK